MLSCIKFVSKEEELILLLEEYYEWCDSEEINELKVIKRDTRGDVYK